MDDEVLLQFARCLAEVGRSPKTIEAYTSGVRRVMGTVRERGRPITLAEVTPIDLAEWRYHRASEARPATVNLEVDALRQFFRWAYACGVIPADPSNRLRHVDQGLRVAPRWLTRQEQYRLLQATQLVVQMASTDRRRMLAARDGALVALMLHAGLRLSEVCRLDVGDVVISDRKGTVTVRNGKGGKRRQVPLNRDAQEAVARWLSHRGGGGDHLFPGDKRERLSSRAVEVAIVRLSRVAGLRVSPYQLRHTFCHELVAREGVPLDLVALLAGHTTASGLPRPQTTVRYTTPSEREPDYEW